MGAGRHHYFYRVEVLGTGTATRTKFSVFTFQVFETFFQLEVEIGEARAFLAGFAFCVYGAVLFLFVEGYASLQLSTLRLIPHVMFMEFIHLYDMHF